MKPTQRLTSLFLLATLAACGDSSAPRVDGASQAGSALPDPADTLAALSPEAQPYGLNVYNAHCLSCHGELGQGLDGHPTLAGLARPAMQRKLLDYRAGQLPDEKAAAMTRAVAALNEAEIAAVSIYAGE